MNFLVLWVPSEIASGILSKNIPRISSEIPSEILRQIWKFGKKIIQIRKIYQIYDLKSYCWSYFLGETMYGSFLRQNLSVCKFSSPNYPDTKGKLPLANIFSRRTHTFLIVVFFSLIPQDCHNVEHGDASTSLIGLTYRYLASSRLSYKWFGRLWLPTRKHSWFVDSPCVVFQSTDPN